MLIDLIFVALLVFACIKGYRKGFIIALFSLIAYIVGIAAALKLSAVVAQKLSENVTVSGKWLPALSFILVFVVVAILINIGGKLIQKTFELAMLGWANRIAGALLFIALYSFIYSIILFYAVQLHLFKETTISASQTYSFLKPLGPRFIDMIGVAIPFFKDIFAQLEEFFGYVSNKMQH